MVIPIEDEDFQTVHYFLCLEKEREKFQELIVFAIVSVNAEDFSSRRLRNLKRIFRSILYLL